MDRWLRRESLAVLAVTALLPMSARLSNDLLDRAALDEAAPQHADLHPMHWEIAAAHDAIAVGYLQGKGRQSHPVAGNDTPGARAKNRRTDALTRPD